MAISRTDIRQSFTTNGPGDDILQIRGVKRGEPVFINLIVSGTFSGDGVVLQESLPDANEWVNIPDAGMSQPSTTVVKVVAPGDFRWFSGIASGTANCSAVAQ